LTDGSSLGLPSGWTKTQSISGDVITYIVNPGSDISTLTAYNEVQCTYSTTSLSPEDLFPISSGITGSVNLRIEVKAHKDATVNCLTIDYLGQ
jgi:hypothetical protein